MKIDIPDDDKEKINLMMRLAKEDTYVLCQAYLYAVNLARYGVDVTEKWETATQQSASLHRAYIRGRYDELQIIKEQIGIDDK